MNPTVIAILEKSVIAGGAALLGYLSQHSSDFGTAWSPAVAAISAVLLAWLNKSTGSQMVKALSMPAKIEKT